MFLCFICFYKNIKGCFYFYLHIEVKIDFVLVTSYCMCYYVKNMFVYLFLFKKKTYLLYRYIVLLKNV